MNTRIEQLFPGVHLIHSAVGGRPLQLPVLVDADAAMLVDSGCASDVDRVILPALSELGIGPEKLTYLLNTHCDVDHQGGNAGLMRFASQARLLCGTMDQAEIESPAVIMERRYNAYARDHLVHYDDPTRAWLLGELGEGRNVDRTLNGGEIISLGAGRELQIIHLPGHSRGHLGVWDRRNHILLGGDAVQGESYLDLQGRPALCPTYLHVQPYLETLRRVESYGFSGYVGCHWPVCRGSEEISRFCGISRDFVYRAEMLLLHHLRGCERGATLRELCEAVGPRLGRWPQAVNIELCYAFTGHLDDLAARQLVRPAAGTPVTFHAK